MDGQRCVEGDLRQAIDIRSKFSRLAEALYIVEKFQLFASVLNRVGQVLPGKDC